MSTSLIIECLVVLVAIIGFSIYHAYKSQLPSEFESEPKSEPEPQPQPETAATQQQRTAAEFFMEMAQKYQFHLEELQRDEDGVWWEFVYQQGHFGVYASLKNEKYILYYNNSIVLPYSVENYQAVQLLCHHMNSEYMFGKMTYTYDGEDNTLSVNQSIANIGTMEDALLHYFRITFEMQQIAKAYLQGRHPSEEDEYDEMRQRYMLLDTEMKIEHRKLKERKPRCVDPNHGTLIEYVSYLFTTEKIEDLLRLTVQSSTKHSVLTRQDQIAAYNVLADIVTPNEGGYCLSVELPVVYTLETVVNHYVFTLHPVDSVNGAHYVRMTAVCTPHEHLQDYMPNGTYEPQAISMLLCYAEPDNLPAVDEEIELPTSTIGKQIHYGHLLMQQKCYLQAIAVLTPVFKILKEDFYND